MEEIDTAVEPDWDLPLKLQLTPAGVIHALFASADSVHTGWDSCIDHGLVATETTAIDDLTGNHCRLVKQEYVEDHEPDQTWHDWVVELKLGDTYISAHWRVQHSTTPVEWEWCVSEAENAFATGCVLIGKRVRRGLVIEEPPNSLPGSRTHH